MDSPSGRRRCACVTFPSLHATPVLGSNHTTSSGRTGSVALWRPDHILQTRSDIAVAADVAGSTPALLLKNLHYAVEEISLHRGVATLVTLDTRPDVHVPAGQVRGLGSWIDDKHNPGILRPTA